MQPHGDASETLDYFRRNFIFVPWETLFAAVEQNLENSRNATRRPRRRLGLNWTIYFRASRNTILQDGFMRPPEVKASISRLQQRSAIADR